MKFLEDAELDNNTNIIAKKIIKELIDVVYEYKDKKDLFIVTKVNKKPYPYFILNEKYLQNIVEKYKILFAFGFTDNNIGGFSTTTTEKVQFIGINCIFLDNIGPMKDQYEIMKYICELIVMNSNIQTILLHEVHHYLDSLRNKTIYAYTKKSNKNSCKEYFNDASEFNAYFHNFAEPLYIVLSINNKNYMIKMMKENGITSNFNETIQNIVRNNRYKNDEISNQLTEYFNYLNKQNKKRLVSRLYHLFIEVQKHLKELNNQDLNT